MCVNSSHHQHCETKLSKLLAPDKVLFFSVVFVHAVKSPIHHGNQAGHVYSQCKHMVCHSAPRQSIPPVTTTAAMGSACVWSCLTSSLMSGMMGQCASSASLQKVQGWEEWLIDHRVATDLERKKKWAHRSFMKFNKLKCKVLPLGRNYPRHQHMLGPPIWKAALQKGTWGQKVEHEPSVCCFSKC